MTPELLAMLRCPDCVADTVDNDTVGLLDANEVTYRGHRLWQGRLQCRNCRQVYPIRDGIPRFYGIRPLSDSTDSIGDGGLSVGQSNSSVQADIATNFGDAWQLYAEANAQSAVAEATDKPPHVHPYRLEQFLDWIEPLQPEDFTGKTVLDMGSGLGGFTAFSAGFGACHVVGLEISHAVNATVGLLEEHPNLDFVQGNILRPPFLPGSFDLVYSIGVLHHLESPPAGFQQAAKQLTSPGGRLFIWVYGRENNGFVVYVVDPLRKLLSKLPVSWVRHGIALPMALVLYPLLHTFYHPALKSLFGGLPYWDYFQWLRNYGFSYTRGMITDQLIPPRTHYHTQEELRGWYAQAGLALESITHRNAISWRVLGRL